MKIDFQSLSVNQNVDVEKTSKSTASSARKADTDGGYKVDISGTVMDNAAYGTGELKTAQEIMQDAGGQQDVALQRNYMAVMSNSMSTEDFAKLQEEGFHPGSTTIETAVTVLDEIKATLADAGVVIEGFTDDISGEELEAITGNAGRAMAIEEKLKEKDLPVTKDNMKAVERALDLAGNMTQLSDGAIRYMVQNDLEPTIDNIYKAEYSSSNSNEGSRQPKGYYLDGSDSRANYYAKKADSNDIDWDQLKEQIEKIIKDAGFTVDDTTMENSKWLIEKGIPLTGETLAKVTELRTVELPMKQEDILNAVLSAIADGKEAKNAVLSEGGDKSILDKAIEIKQQVEQISKDAIQAVIENGEEPTIENLSRVTGLEGETSGVTKASYELIAAQRTLEEIRLQMTVEANARLLRSGFSIETEPIEKVIEALKETEKAYYQVLFGKAENADQEKIALYKETTNTLFSIKALPAAVLGRMSTAGEAFTLSHVQEEGVILKAAYDKAEQTYEALGTAPRSDMGDSIQKAFQNVDSLLKGMGLETTEANRRAVRILGYNRMAITQESVAQVKEADYAVRSLIEKMTPAATIDIIRKGENPLETPVYELIDKLDALQEGGTGTTSTGTRDSVESEATAMSEQAERYSEYLWKLEKSNGITAEERAAYIGIYRLFHQIEKSDSSVIGSVIQNYANAGQNAGLDTGVLTLKNLLAAARTNQAVGKSGRTGQAGIDVTVDAEFGMLEELNKTGASISEQIETGFRQSYPKALAKDILNHLSPDKLQNMKISMNTTLEEFAEKLQEADENAELRTEYLEEQMQDIQKAQATEDYVLQTLIDFDQPVTIDNILAESTLLNSRGSTFRQLFEQAARRDSREGTKFSEELKENVDQLHEGLSEEESTKKTYENLQKLSEEILDVDGASHIRSIDVKSMNLLYKQITLATNLSKEENYEIPVMIGDEWTSINLKIIKGDTTGKTSGGATNPMSGKVSATMDINGLGKVAAEFQMKETEGNNEEKGFEISGFVSCDNSVGTEILSRTEAMLKEALTSEKREVGEVYFIQSKELNIQKFGSEVKETKVSEQKTAAINSTKELYEVAKAFITVMKGVTNL